MKKIVGGIGGIKKHYSWNSFKRSYLRLDGKEKDMAFESFLTWSKILNISVDVKVIQEGNYLANENKHSDKDLEKTR